eukprot:1916121-Amphidinium_carterae.1
MVWVSSPAPCRSNPAQMREQSEVSCHEEGNRVVEDETVDDKKREQPNPNTLPHHMTKCKVRLVCLLGSSVPFYMSSHTLRVAKPRTP